MTVRRRATSRRDTLDGCFEQELVKVYMLDEYESFKLILFNVKNSCFILACLGYFFSIQIYLIILDKLFKLYLINM